MLANKRSCRTLRTDLLIHRFVAAVVCNSIITYISVQFILLVIVIALNMFTLAAKNYIQGVNQCC